MTGFPMMTASNSGGKKTQKSRVREVPARTKLDHQEAHFPGLAKSNRARTLVRRSLLKSKTDAFATKVDAVLNIASQLYMIEQLWMRHPNKAVRAAGYAKERNDALKRLALAHGDLIALI